MKYKYDIAVLTGSQYVNPTEINSYVQNIIDEDQMVVDALESKGLKVIRIDWSNNNFDWLTAKTALFRTTWDYYDRIIEFRLWLDRVAKHLDFINPVSLVKWNFDKHYLLDLQKYRLPIPKTYIIKKGSEQSLKDLVIYREWKEYILKPTVSGSARHTYRLSKDNIDDYEIIFRNLIKQEDMMLQPFFKSVLSTGEVSLVFFDGKYSHAMKKIAKPGDFRVQDEFGGTVHHYLPDREEIKLSKKAISICEPTPVYSRVDLIKDNSGQPVISEIELIEPELWFRYNPDTVNTFADVIVKHLGT